jgi:hypothetical protein
VRRSDGPDCLPLANPAIAKKAGPGLRLIIVLGAILLLTLIVYLYLPYAPRTMGELCGTYVLDCELVKEELILRPDGTFTQTATIKVASKKVSSEGTWTYGTRLSSGLAVGDVTLDGFVALLKWPDELTPDYAHSRPGIAVLPAEYWFGRLILGGRVDSWPDWKKVK